jgi:hypothetical protein
LLEFGKNSIEILLEGSGAIGKAVQVAAGLGLGIFNGGRGYS